MAEITRQVRFEELPLGEQPGPPCGPTPASPVTSNQQLLSRRATLQSESGKYCFFVVN